MTPNRITAVLVSAALFGFLVPAALAQQLVPLGTEGDWEYAYTQTAEGDFEVCMATKGLKNDEAVLFYSDGDFLLLGFFLKRWQLDQRETYDVSLKINGGQPIPSTAVAGADRSAVLIDAPMSDHFDALHSASTLTLVTGAGPIDFDISGAGAALDAIVDCVAVHAPQPK